MGAVECLDKEEYWSTISILLGCFLISKRTCTLFGYWWRHIYIQETIYERYSAISGTQRTEDAEFWFYKVSYPADHVLEISKKILNCPIIALWLHEMMVHF